MNVRGISPEMRADESGRRSWTRFFYLPKRLFLLALGVRVSKRGTLVHVQATFCLISCSGRLRHVPRISFISRYCSWGCLSAACLWLETQSPPWHPRPGIALGMSVCEASRQRDSLYRSVCSVDGTSLYGKCCKHLGEEGRLNMLICICCRHHSEADDRNEQTEVR